MPVKYDQETRVSAIRLVCEHAADYALEYTSAAAGESHVPTRRDPRGPASYYRQPARR